MEIEEETLSTEETVGIQMIKSVTLTAADTREREPDIETMLINLVFRKTTNRQTKLNNHLRTVKMMTILNNQFKHSSQRS